MNSEVVIKRIVTQTEAEVEALFEYKFRNAAKPPPIDPFKASAMAEIARRIRNRAMGIEEDA